MYGIGRTDAFDMNVCAYLHHMPDLYFCQYQDKKRLAEKRLIEFDGKGLYAEHKRALNRLQLLVTGTGDAVEAAEKEV